MFEPEKIGADCSSCLVRGRPAQPQTNITKATSECSQLGLSGTRDVPATEGVVRRPARASLLDAEKTRATSMSPETCCDLLERQRSLNRAMLQCLRTNRFVHFFVVGSAVEGQHGSQRRYKHPSIRRRAWRPANGAQ